ncbi:MAG: HPF/RaiA family ribosome-associated protein [Nocardioidaceae bacterium]
MKVLVHTDRNIHADASEVRRIEDDLTNALERFTEDLTRVEVHLSDESAGTSTDEDIACLLEARPAGRDPVTVSHQAATLAESLAGATRKLKALLTHTFDRLAEKDERDTIRRH